MGWFVLSRKLDERTKADPSASNVRISNGSVTYKQLMVKLTQLFKEAVTQVSRSFITLHIYGQYIILYARTQVSNPGPIGPSCYIFYFTKIFNLNKK